MSSVLWDQHPWDEKPLEKELQLPTSQRTLWQNDRNNFAADCDQIGSITLQDAKKTP